MIDNPEHILEQLIELALRVTDVPRGKFLVTNTNKAARDQRDALWYIARETYDIPVATIASRFGASRRTVVNACTRVRRNPCALTAARILHGRMAYALRELQQDGRAEVS